MDLESEVSRTARWRGTLLKCRRAEAKPFTDIVYVRSAKRLSLLLVGSSLMNEKRMRLLDNGMVLIAVAICCYSLAAKVLFDDIQKVACYDNIRKEESRDLRTMRIKFQWIIFCLMGTTMAYDPDDKSLKEILLPEGQFEAFYLKGAQDEEQNAVRPPHLHGSFHQYKNPALVSAPNSAAYGFRFDGKRRFNFD